MVEGEWVSARDAQTLVAAVYRNVGVNDEIVRHTARISILAWLHHGFLTARADPSKYKFERQRYTGKGETGWENEAEFTQTSDGLGEGNIIPEIFWWGVQQSIAPFYSFEDDPNWEFGFFPVNCSYFKAGLEKARKGQLSIGDYFWRGRVEDVEFRRTDLLAFTGQDSLASLALQKATPSNGSGGRPTVLDWEHVALQMAGLYYKGELQPKTIADVIRAIQHWANLPDGGPPDDTVRPHAKAIFQAFKSWEIEN